MRDFKYAVYLEDIFIRNIVSTASCKGNAEHAIWINLKELYPEKYSLLKMKRI